MVGARVARGSARTSGCRDQGRQKLAPAGARQSCDPAGPCSDRQGALVRTPAATAAATHRAAANGRDRSRPRSRPALASAAASSGARLGRGGVRLDCAWLAASDPVDTAAVGLLGGKLEPELLAHHAGKEPPHRVRLPAGGFHDGGDRGPVRPAQQPQHPRLLGIRSRPVMRSSALASNSLGPDFGGGARLDGPRTLALGHVKTPLHGVGATARRTTQTPRRPNGAGGARGASRSGSASVTVTTMHALFTSEVECKMASALMRLDPRDAVRSSAPRSSAEILAGVANPYQAACTRRISAAGLAPSSGEVVTEFQSDNSRTDSPVRILNDVKVLAAAFRGPCSRSRLSQRAPGPWPDRTPAGPSSAPWRQRCRRDRGGVARLPPWSSDAS